MTACRSSRSMRATPPRSRSRRARRAPPWTVMQRVDHPDPAAANEQALHDLENGATGLTLVLPGSVNANGYGLDASADDARARVRRHLSRCRRRHRLHRQRRDTRCGEELRRTGEAARHRAGTRSRCASASIRSGGMAATGEVPCAVEQARADLRGADRRTRGPRLSRAVRGGGRAGDPQCRRLGGAGARLRARQRGHLSARARSGRHRARCRAPHDLFPPRRGRRPVSHHREIPRVRKAVGARRAGVRTRARRRPMSRPRPRGA